MMIEENQENKKRLEKRVEKIKKNLGKYSLEFYEKLTLYVNLSQTLLDLNKYEESLNFYIEALHFSKTRFENSPRYYQRLCDIYRGICEISKQQKDTENLLKNSEFYLKFSKKLQSLSEITQSYKYYTEALTLKSEDILEEINLEKCYLKRRSLDRDFESTITKAIDCALNYHEKSKLLMKEDLIYSSESTTEALFSLANCYFVYGEYDDKHWKFAIDKFKTCLKEAQKGNLKLLEARCYSNLGVINQNVGKLRLAMQYFKNFLDISKEMKNWNDEYSAMNSLGFIYVKIQSYDKAFIKYKNCKILAFRNGNEELKEKALENIEEVKQLKILYEENYLNDVKKFKKLKSKYGKFSLLEWENLLKKILELQVEVDILEIFKNEDKLYTGGFEKEILIFADIIMEKNESEEEKIGVKILGILLDILTAEKKLHKLSLVLYEKYLDILYEEMRDCEETGIEFEDIYADYVTGNIDFCSKLCDLDKSLKKIDMIYERTFDMIKTKEDEKLLFLLLYNMEIVYKEKKSEIRISAVGGLLDELKIKKESDAFISLKWLNIDFTKFEVEGEESEISSVKSQESDFLKKKITKSSQKKRRRGVKMEEENHFSVKKNSYQNDKIEVKKEDEDDNYFQQNFLDFQDFNSDFAIPVKREVQKKTEFLEKQIPKKKNSISIFNNTFVEKANSSRNSTNLIKLSNLFSQKDFFHQFPLKKILKDFDLSYNKISKPFYTDFFQFLISKINNRHCESLRKINLEKTSIDEDFFDTLLENPFLSYLFTKDIEYLNLNFNNITIEKNFMRFFTELFNNSYGSISELRLNMLNFKGDEFSEEFIERWKSFISEARFLRVVELEGCKLVQFYLLKFEANYVEVLNLSRNCFGVRTILDFLLNKISVFRSLRELDFSNQDILEYVGEAVFSEEFMKEIKFNENEISLRNLKLKNSKNFFCFFSKLSPMIPQVRKIYEIFGLLKILDLSHNPIHYVNKILSNFMHKIGLKKIKLERLILKDLEDGDDESFRELLKIIREMFMFYENFKYVNLEFCELSETVEFQVDLMNKKYITSGNSHTVKY